jgi:ribokinase
VTTRICVLGSLNLDLVVRAPRLPRGGETLLGGPFASFPGGKGANQAVAAARMGASVGLIGAVGRDAYGAELLGALEENRVDTANVMRRADAPSGVALITVDAQGENHIVVAPGANATLTPRDIEQASGAIERSDLLLAQLEVPLPALERAFAIAREARIGTMLNAAPARELPRGLLEQVDVLLVNEGEARALVRGGESWDELVRKLQDLGPRSVVLTLGARGAIWRSGEETVQQDGLRVEVVDTTACGDAFAGAFAAATGHAKDPAERLRWACAAGALAATKAGAIPSLPSGGEVREFLECKPLEH